MMQTIHVLMCVAGTKEKDPMSRYAFAPVLRELELSTNK